MQARRVYFSFALCPVPDSVVKLVVHLQAHARACVTHIVKSEMHACTCCTFVQTRKDSCVHGAAITSQLWKTNALHTCINPVVMWLHSYVFACVHTHIYIYMYMKNGDGNAHLQVNACMCDVHNHVHLQMQPCLYDKLVYTYLLTPPHKNMHIHV